MSYIATGHAGSPHKSEVRTPPVVQVPAPVRSVSTGRTGVTEEEFDALYEAKGRALRAAAAAQGVPLDRVRLTDAQNRAVNAKARAAYKSRSSYKARSASKSKANTKRRAAPRQKAGFPGPEGVAAGDDNTLLYVGLVGAAAMVGLLLFGKR